MQLAQIDIREDLGIQLQQDAERNDTTVDQLLNQAVEEFLRNKQRAKIDVETTAYISLHPKLWKTKPGQWVAIHNQKLVDSDADRVSLYRRVRKTYGRTPVLIREVKTDPVDEIRIITRSTGKIEQ